MHPYKSRTTNWRILYRIGNDAIMIAEVFHKTAQTTPKAVTEVCQKRLAQYDKD